MHGELDQYISADTKARKYLLEFRSREILALQN